MADFNPDEYLAQKTQAKFDPDAYLASKLAPKEQPQEKGILKDGFMQGVGNLAAGAVRGAGSIGSTILAPYDIAQDAINHRPLMQSNNERRAEIDSGLQMMGADPNSGLYKTGKIGGEIAGTAGAGGALGAGVKELGATRLGNAITSGGMSLGENTGGKLANALLRVGGGGVAGASQAGLIDPNSAGTGASIGMALPVVGKAAGEVGSLISNRLDDAGHYLMQSALKPTIAQRKSGEADRAIKTLLDEGLNATKGGVEQLQSRIGDINDNIKMVIGRSNKTVNKQDVIAASLVAIDLILQGDNLLRLPLKYWKEVRKEIENL